MTVEKAGTVDAVGTDKENGKVRLSIFDNLRWDTDHLRMLQDEINAYLGFIKSNGSYAPYANANGRVLVVGMYT